MPAVGLCQHIKSLEYGRLKEECKDKSDNYQPRIHNVFEDVFSNIGPDALSVIHKSLDEGKSKVSTLFWSHIFILQ